MQGIAIDWAYNGGSTETGSIQLRDWNYTNSMCYFDGCYDERRSPFNTYSISRVPCTGKFTIKTTKRIKMCVINVPAS